MLIEEVMIGDGDTPMPCQLTKVRDRFVNVVVDVQCLCTIHDEVGAIGHLHKAILEHDLLNERHVLIES